MKTKTRVYISKTNRKTVASKLRRWYPRPEQREHPLVVLLERHMIKCKTCRNRSRILCVHGYDMAMDADKALGFRKQ